MATLAHDLRQAFRALARGRLVTVLAVAAFALGIGVTSAVFSIFNGVLLRPLPFPDPDRLVMVFDTQPACTTCPASFPKYHDWKERNRVFAAIGGAAPAPFVLTGQGDAERISGVRATASLRDVFGVDPSLGRWFREDEDLPGAPKVVVLSHGLWTRRFARETAALGRTLTIDGEPHEVIGVMPEDFNVRGFGRNPAEVFVPLAMALDPATRGSHFMPTYARLADGVTLERATSEMRALGRTLAVEHGHNHGVDVRSFREVIVGNVRTPLRVLLGAVALVLLIACANVANLLLARGLARRGELAIRVTLGASLRDLARQLAVEGIVLAVAGGIVGLLFAWWAVRTFAVMAADQLPRAASIGVDGRVVAFTAGLSLLVGILCGLWPIARLGRADLAATIRESDTRTRTGGGRRFGDGLVVAEVALTFALMIGGALLVKNLVLLQGRDSGLRADGVVAFDVAPSGPRYESDEAVAAFYRDLVGRLGALGGVESAAVISHLPMYRFGTNGEMSREGGNPWPDDSAPLVEYRWYDGDYFATLGIPLVRGRLLDERDGPGTTTVVVNQAMADKFWPGQDPIGRRFGQPGGSWWDVVGVVADVRSYGLAQPAPYEFYRRIEQSPIGGGVTVVLRSTRSDPAALVPSARGIVRSIDPEVPVTRVQTVESVIADSVGQPRMLSALIGLFAVLAGVLAMVGVYGVMAYNVHRQRRELGIRLALGAERSSIEGLVMGRGAVLALIGVVIGLGGAWALTRTMESMLNDVRPGDPFVFFGTAVAVFAAVALASWVPARAAGRVDPILVLRDA